MEAYRKGQSYGRAVELSRRHFQVTRLTYLLTSEQ